MPMMELEDATIHYVDKGSGPIAMIYCHDMGDSGEPFESSGDQDWYAQHFRVISWDNRGLGRSGPSRKYSLPLYAADAAHLLDKLGIEKAIVLGVSWGGIVAIRFALDYPEKTLALVVDSSSPETNLAMSESWYLSGEASRLGAAALAGREPMKPAFELHNPMTPERADATQARMKLKPEHLDSHVAQLRVTAGLREHPMTPYLHNITAPTLAVGGTMDASQGNRGLTLLARNVPNARLEIFETSHGVLRRDRVGFRTLLFDFLRTNGIMDIHPNNYSNEWWKPNSRNDDPSAAD